MCVGSYVSHLCVCWVWCASMQEEAGDACALELGREVEITKVTCVDLEQPSRLHPECVHMCVCVCVCVCVYVCACVCACVCMCM